MDPTINNDSRIQKDKLEEVTDKIKVSNKEDAQLKTAELITSVVGGFMCNFKIIKVLYKLQSFKLKNEVLCDIDWFCFLFSDNIHIESLLL